MMNEYAQAVQDILDSPLMKQIVSSLNPDPEKLREAVEASIRAVALEREREAVKDFGAAAYDLRPGEGIAVWGTPSEPDPAIMAKEKETSAQLAEVFYKLQAVATPGELRVIFEDNAWTGFAEVVQALRRHDIDFLGKK